MLNIESTLWKLRTFPGGSAYVTQKASGVTRYANRSELPSNARLSEMTERQFDRVCREAFHGNA